MTGDGVGLGATCQVKRTVGKGEGRKTLEGRRAEDPKNWR